MDFKHLKAKLKFRTIRLFWKIIPYVSLLLAAVGFLILSNFLGDDDWKNWFLAISANAASVFLIFFLYEFLKARSQKELNKEVFEYAKRVVDKDIYSILHTLSKFYYGFQRGRIWSQTFDLTRKSPEELEILIKDRKFAGFELFKSWDEIYEYFSKILENNFVLSRMDDDQILVILEMQSTLASIKRSFKDRNNFLETKQTVTNFKIIKGEDINPENSQYPNRFIFLRDIGDGKNVVEDFGDFTPTDVSNLLKVYKIKPEAVEPITMWTHIMFSQIRKWLELTGGHLYIPMD